MADRFDVEKEWSKVEPMFRSLREPKRPAVNFASLWLKLNGGVDNIIKVYEQATEEEKDYWGRWYLHASGEVQDIANRWDVSVPVAAGVVAVLSPGNLWWRNVLIADKLIAFWRHKALNALGPISSYPSNIQKAVAILDSQDPDRYVGGPKVGVFYDSLVDPEGVERAITLDGHAINIARGRKVPLREVGVPNETDRLAMENAYREAGKRLGVTPQAVQATTWVIWKSVTKGVAEATLLIRAAIFLEAQERK